MTRHSPFPVPCSLFPVVVLLVLAAAPGCKSARYKQERSSAEKQISLAKEAQADADSLDVAQQSLEFAREIEAEALAHIDQGDDDLAVAKAWANEATSRRTLQSEQLARTEEKLASARRVSNTPKAQLESIERTRNTLRRQIELSDLEVRHSDAAIRAASARIEASEQRLQVARSLYVDAEQQAKTAEIEALSRSRAELDQKVAPPKQ